MKLTGVGEQLTESTISDFEVNFNIKLPDDYKVFLLGSNGGVPGGNWCFDFIENGSTIKTSSVISYFEVLYAEETMEVDDLRAGYVALVESGQVPSTLLPIADDPFGNIIFISVGEDDFGRVYFGNHELEVPETGYLVMSQIAETFSEFMDKLYLYNGE